MPPKKPLSQNLQELEEKLNLLAQEQDTEKKGRIRTAIDQIKKRLKKQTTGEPTVMDQVNKKLDELNKGADTQEKKTRLRRLKEFFTGKPDPKIFSAQTTPDTSSSSSSSSSGSATPQEDQPLLQKEEKEEKEEQPKKRGPGRPRKPRKPVGRPSNIQQLTEAEQEKDKYKEVLLDLMFDKTIPFELIQEIYKMVPDPTEEIKKQIEQRRQQQVQKTKETKERKQQERQQQQKQQQQQEKEQEQQQLIQTVRESTQQQQEQQEVVGEMMSGIFDKYNLTDNINKAEAEGSNTQTITPDYLLRSRERPDIIEMKQGVPPPNQRRQVNELMNDEVETVPDVINVNQNQVGINESTSREQVQDNQFRENDLNYTFEQRRAQSLKQMNDFLNKDHSQVYDSPDVTEYISGTEELYNPHSSSSNPDNTNYENTTEDKRNQLLQAADDLHLSTEESNQLMNFGDDELNNIYDSYLEDDARNQNQGNTALMDVSRALVSAGQRAGGLVPAGRDIVSRFEEAQLGQRVSQIAGQAIAGAQAGAMQGIQQGGRLGVRQAVEGGLEGGIRGGASGAIIGQLGGGVAGQLGNIAAQRGITDILGRIRRMVGAGGEEQPDEQTIISQIDNINKELNQIGKDPLRYPEFRDITQSTFPGPGDQRNNIKLVQNSVTSYLNDQNLYGGGFTYEDIQDI